MDTIYYAVYDEESDSYQEMNVIKGVQEMDVTIDEDKVQDSFSHLSRGYEGTLTVVESNIREMSPTLRKYFRSIRMIGKIYL
ncbi:hypothetical protein [Virgibacillus salexigens]|uniref:Uncharacterized protein n=1 Tax=Virgibacillus kapii TaxID=1638645 RepID=A0ABQ2DLN9_9BACI|nr:MULTISPECIES: hypothetical protein [Virgibacillus]GGJ61907.1 hypothetical protein GCM10007111_25000 [Virgibacillus kapii]